MKTPRLQIILLLATCALPWSSPAQTPAKPGGEVDPGSTQRFWTQLDYLHWWMKGNPLPPLVTTSPPGVNGVLPGSTVLFGGNRVDGEGRNGGRLSVGYWLDERHQFGLEGSVILIGFNGGSRFSATSNGTPVLARPFFNVSLGAPDSFFVAAPGIVAGTISVSTSNELQTVSVGLKRNWRHTDRYRIDLIGGYRFFRYGESLSIEQASVSGGASIHGSDYFSANNTFNAGEVGLEGECNHGPWSLDLAGKVALGNQHQVGQIRGETNIGGTTMVGNLLALSSNIGSQSKNKFAVLPQASVNASYSFSDKFSVSLGYTILYLNDVLRTSGQIDQNINPSLLPPVIPGGPADPQPKMNSSSFWAQGISAGLKYRF